jgi:hypothetical protein
MKDRKLSILKNTDKVNNKKNNFENLKKKKN